MRRSLTTIARRGVQRSLSATGYHLARNHPVPDPAAAASAATHRLDVDGATAATIDAVQGYTLTPPERVIALCDAVRYVVAAGVPGALVECGVWRGGSSLAMVRTLLDLGVTDRHVYMFDTFDKMPEPGHQDVDCFGVAAATYHDLLAAGGDYDHDTYDYLPFGEVQGLLRATGYPQDHLHFVQGMVEDTLPGSAPDRAALVRLDTDYYQSTRHELDHLYPRLSPGGVLLIDDYGHFLGCRQAVDEFAAHLADNGTHLYLHRIDYSARLAIVPATAGAAATHAGAPADLVGMPG